MVEFAMVTTIFGLFIIFTIDASMTLYRYSSLRNVTGLLTRHLATDLGRSWSNRSVDGEPWNGSCNSYIRSAADAFLASYGSDYSATMSNRGFYFGDTMDNTAALVTDPAAPYAVVRIVGRFSPSCFLCKIMPRLNLTTESSFLVEYRNDACSDYH